MASGILNRLGCAEMSLGAAGKSACATNPGPQWRTSVRRRTRTRFCVPLLLWRDLPPPRRQVQLERRLRERWIYFELGIRDLQVIVRWLQDLLLDRIGLAVRNP